MESMKCKGTTFPKSVASKSFWHHVKRSIFCIFIYIYIYIYICSIMYIHIFMKIKCKFQNPSWYVLILRSYGRKTLNLASKYLPQRCWWMYPLGAHLEEHKSNSTLGLSKTKTWAPRKLFPLLTKTQFKESQDFLYLTHWSHLEQLSFPKLSGNLPKLTFRRADWMWTAWKKILLEVV